MARMTILITGVSGFIGRSFVEEIVNRKLPWHIYGIDIKKPCFNDNKYLDSIMFDMLDIRNSEAVSEYFKNKRFDGVIHLAAVSRVIDAEKDKENCIYTNLFGTKNLLENIAKVSDTWVIFGSSREVYGEQYRFPVKENAEKKPINIYGMCKFESEILVKKLIKRHLNLRFSNVYGNNYDIMNRVIPAFVKGALSNDTLYIEGGGQIIDFTYIRDTTDCLIKAAELLQSNAIEAEDIHICPGNENNITDIVSYLSIYLNRELKVLYLNGRSYDVIKFVGDSAKRKKILCEKDFIPLKEGIYLLLESWGKCLEITGQDQLPTGLI